MNVINNTPNVITKKKMPVIAIFIDTKNKKQIFYYFNFKNIKLKSNIQPKYRQQCKDS